MLANDLELRESLRKLVGFTEALLTLRNETPEEQAKLYRIVSTPYILRIRDLACEAEAYVDGHLDWDITLYGVTVTDDPITPMFPEAVANAPHWQFQHKLDEKEEEA